MHSPGEPEALALDVASRAMAPRGPIRRRQAHQALQPRGAPRAAELTNPYDPPPGRIASGSRACAAHPARTARAKCRATPARTADGPSTGAAPSFAPQPDWSTHVR